MRHDDPRLIDALAAEYVLGTLRGAARMRFERWRAAAWHIERRVQAWEERFLPLVFSLSPIQPSPQVWSQIERRISSEVPASTSGTRRPALRAIAAALLLFAVLGGGFAVWRATQAPAYEPFAMIAMPNGAMAWKLEMDGQGGRMRISAMAKMPKQPDRSFELWALPDSGGAPLSLGVLPDTGQEVHAMSSTQLRVLTASSKVAVSLEPRGGSPTGAPTGPVLFVADRIKEV